MRTRLLLFSLTAGLVVALFAAPAGAQVAEQLFRDGKRLMSEGKIGEACAAFEGSYRKEAAVTTLLNLADCREKNGQLASAWARFVDADRMTRGEPDQASFNGIARQRATGLEGRLSYLTIEVPDPARIDGLTITRDGQPVDQAEWNHAIPVDGGTWKIEGTAPGHDTWSTTVTVGEEKDRQAVTVPRLRGASGGSDRDGVDRRSRFNGKRKVALGLGAVGVAGVVAGTLLYVQATGIYDDAKQAPALADRERLTGDANARYLQAQLGWGLGAAAIGGAAVLWIMGRPPAPASSVGVVPRLDATGGGLVVTGRF